MDFIAAEFNQRVVGEGLGQVFAEDASIDGQCAPCGNFVLVGFLDDDRAESAEFFVEETGGAIGGLGTEGVATDEFGEVFAVVGGAFYKGPHFMEHDGNSGLGDLPRGFGSGQSTADDVNGLGLGEVCHGRS